MHRVANTYSLILGFSQHGRGYYPPLILGFSKHAQGQHTLPLILDSPQACTGG